MLDSCSTSHNNSQYPKQLTKHLLINTWSSRRLNPTNLTRILPTPPMNWQHQQILGTPSPSFNLIHILQKMLDSRFQCQHIGSLDWQTKQPTFFSSMWPSNQGRHATETKPVQIGYCRSINATSVCVIQSPNNAILPHYPTDTPMAKPSNKLFIVPVFPFSSVLLTVPLKTALWYLEINTICWDIYCHLTMPYEAPIIKEKRTNTKKRKPSSCGSAQLASSTGERD